jgi:excisionase family DNA binding protein
MELGTRARTGLPGHLGGAHESSAGARDHLVAMLVEQVFAHTPPPGPTLLRLFRIIRARRQRRRLPRPTGEQTMPCTDCHNLSAANVAAAEASSSLSPGLISVNSGNSSFVRKPEYPARAGESPSAACAEPELLTLRETAARLRVGTAVVVGLAKRGELPHKRVGRAYRFQRHLVLERLGAGCAARCPSAVADEPDGNH